MQKTIEVIAYKTTSNHGGIVILDINDETVTYTIMTDKLHKKPTTVKLYHKNNGDSYFMFGGRRESLSEYMRTNYNPNKPYMITYDTKSFEIIEYAINF